MISPEIHTKVPELSTIPEPEPKPEESKAKAPAQFIDPAISGVIKDEAITMIDASHLEQNLISQSQNKNMGYSSQGGNQPIDPAIVSFQSHPPSDGKY